MNIIEIDAAGAVKFNGQQLPDDVKIKVTAEQTAMPQIFVNDVEIRDCQVFKNGVLAAYSPPVLPR